MQASAKAGKAEAALRGCQRIQQSNLKEAMRIYFDDFVQQAAVEVEEAVRKTKTGSAPGPDGITVDFFQSMKI